MLEDKSLQPAEIDAVEAESPPIQRKKRLEFMPQDKRRLYFLLILLALATLMLILTFVGRITGSDTILGIVAVFSMGIMSALSPVWPMAGTLACFVFASLGLNPALAAFAAGIAEPIGLMPYYSGGFAVKNTMAKIKGYSRVENWVSRRGGTTALFMACAVPGPWNKPAAAIVGSMKYPFYKFFLVCFIGTTIKSFGYALAGYLVYRAAF
jgi:membrane protein DedA with SNARE-associated domain